MTLDIDPAERVRRPFAARVAWWLAAVMLAGAAVPIAARILGFEWGPLAYLVSLLPWVTFALVVPLATALIVRSWPLVAAAGTMLALGVAWMAPLYIGSAGNADAEPVLRVASVSLTFGLVDADAVVAFVGDHDIDVLALQEVTPAAAQALEDAGLRELLPYSEVRAVGGFQGTALWTRTPMSQAVGLEGFVSQTIRAHVETDAGPLTIYSIHPAAPGPWVNDAWRSDLTLLATELESASGPVMVVGDFNATRDHRGFRDVLALGYVDAADQAGAGFQPTFPADRLPFALVAIDHVMIRDAPLGAVDVSTVELPGADHRVLIATYVAE